MTKTTNRVQEVKESNKTKEQYIAEITQLLQSLDENHAIYTLTFISKLFGNR